METVSSAGWLARASLFAQTNRIYLDKFNRVGLSVIVSATPRCHERRHHVCVRSHQFEFRNLFPIFSLSRACGFAEADAGTTAAAVGPTDVRA